MFVTYECGKFKGLGIRVIDQLSHVTQIPCLLTRELTAEDLVVVAAEVASSQGTKLPDTRTIETEWLELKNQAAELQCSDINVFLFFSYPMRDQSHKGKILETSVYDAICNLTAVPNRPCTAISSSSSSSSSSTDITVDIFLRNSGSSRLTRNRHLLPPSSTVGDIIQLVQPNFDGFVMMLDRVSKTNLNIEQLNEAFVTGVCQVSIG